MNSNLKITKRDGRIEDFNKEKIVNAIELAFLAEDGELTDYAKKKANNIANYIEEKETKEHSTLSVEEIQDLVEYGLMSTKRKDVARRYIIYRNNRTITRLNNNPVMKEIKENLEAKNVQNQNANVDGHSFGGRMGEATDTLLKEIALNNCLTPRAKANHLGNRIYTHDLSHYPLGDHNCLSIPFDDLLKNGFQASPRQGDVRPAQSISSALQLVAVIFQLQSLNQFGGASATHLDYTLVPYVRKSFFKYYMDEYMKDDPAFFELNLLNMDHNTLKEWKKSQTEKYLLENGLTKDDFRFDNKEKLNPKYYQMALFETIKETYQSVEAMYHNLNTLQSRSGNQLPFTSINYGTCTEPEGRLIIKALLDVSISGIGKLHKTSIFPCGIFKLKKGCNRKPGDPNYDLYRLALKSTAQRLYPNYANVDWSGNEGYDPNDPKTEFSTMGCRTANGYDINGFGQLKDGRGNICPVTIIMPTLAMEANGNVEKFMEILDKAIHEARIQLIDRFEWIASQEPDSGKFMYENHVMAGYNPEEGIRSALKHGTLAIGQIGLAETLQILIGKDHTTIEGMNLAKRIESLFRDRCEEFKKEDHLNFGVYYTPAENLCYTSMKKFKETYGEIPNVSDKDFFTNSIHVPVWVEMGPFQKIDIESQLTGYSSAGCITYIELDSGAKNNLEALETIVNYAMDKDIPYFAINVPNDTCLECGYCDEIGNSCPVCGSKKISRLRRVTGYLSGDYLSTFNKGKQQEVEMRVKHTKFKPTYKKIKSAHFNHGFKMYTNVQGINAMVKR